MLHPKSSVFSEWPFRLVLINPSSGLCPGLGSSAHPKPFSGPNPYPLRPAPK